MSFVDVARKRFLRWLYLYLTGKSNKLKETEKSLVMRDTWKYKIKLIIKKIIIAKCQNCVLTQTFRVYNPFFSVKNNRPDSVLFKGKVSVHFIYTIQCMAEWSNFSFNKILSLTCMMFSARSSFSISSLQLQLFYKYDAFEKIEGKISTLSRENVAKETAVNHDNKIKIQPLKTFSDLLLKLAIGSKQDHVN